MEIEIYYKAVSLINAACHIKKQKLHERKGERNYERNYESDGKIFQQV